MGVQRPPGVTWKPALEKLARPKKRDFKQEGIPDAPNLPSDAPNLAQALGCNLATSMAKCTSPAAIRAMLSMDNWAK